MNNYAYLGVEMICLEYGFHNENDYSESNREMKDEKSVVYGSSANI